MKYKTEKTVFIETVRFSKFDLDNLIDFSVTATIATSLKIENKEIYFKHTFFNSNICEVTNQFLEQERRINEAVTGPVGFIIKNTNFKYVFIIGNEIIFYDDADNAVRAKTVDLSEVIR